MKLWQAAYYSFLIAFLMFVVVGVLHVNGIRIFNRNPFDPIGFFFGFMFFFVIFLIVKYGS